VVESLGAERGEREKEEWIWAAEGRRRREVEEECLRRRVAIEEAMRRMKSPNYGV